MARPVFEHGYAGASNRDHLLSFDTTVILGGITVEPRDVVRYNRASYSLEFSGRDTGVPDGVNVADIAVDGTGLLMSFDITVVISQMTVGPEDLVRYEADAFTLYFDGSLSGVPPGAAIDGVHRLSNGHLLLSFDVSGTAGGVAFDDEDILEYTPGAGTWELAYDGSARSPAWPAGDLRAFSIPGPPAAPTGVIATAITGTRVDISWNDVADASSYEVDRRSPGGGYAPTGVSVGNSFSDTKVVAGTSYLYRVRTVSLSGVSQDSAPDLATTVLFTDSLLVAGIVVKAVHLSQLRTAVIAVRALAGSGSTSFTDAATPGTTIRSVHVLEIRSLLDAARSTLVLSTGGYTDGALAGVVIKAVHFQELRNRVQ